MAPGLRYANGEVTRGFFYSAPHCLVADLMDECA